MRRTFLLLTLISAMAAAQTDWEWAKLPPPLIYYDACVVDSTMIAVGQNAGILITRDDGESWEVPVTDLSTGNHLTAITATEGNVFAVGCSGTAIMSKDAGYTWTILDLGTTTNLSDVFFIDQTTGWVAGDDGYLYHTSDGGITWQPNDTGLGMGLAEVQFADSLRGWASGYSAGYGRLYRTLNGGQSWTRGQFNLAPDTSIYGFCTRSDTVLDIPVGRLTFHFPDSLVGFAAAAGSCATYIFKTVDGGLVWDDVHTYYTIDPITLRPGDFWIKEIHFTSPDTGYTVSYDYYEPMMHDFINYSYSISKTENGGATWEGMLSVFNTVYEYGRIHSEYIRTISAMAFNDNALVWAVGRGGLHKTVDDGASWTKFSSPPPNGFLRWLATGEPGFAVVAQNEIREEYYIYRTFYGKGLYATSDWGKSWNKVMGTVAWIMDIEIYNSWNTAWAVGANWTDGGYYIDTDTTSHIYKSVGDFTEWQFVDFSDSLILNAVHFRDQDHGWIGCSDGVILYTADAGSTWVRQQTVSTSSINDVYMADYYTGFATSSDGAILGSFDQGQTWEIVHQADAALDAIAFFSRDIAVVTGESGTVLRSTDGGINWSQIAGWAIDHGSARVYAADGIRGWITGWNYWYGTNTYGKESFLYGTIDAGATWQKLDLESHSTSSSIASWN
ncbi:MAG: hypothetical protein KAU50_07550, partial [Candidatus Marinimicrobia bacterium]|nr:hypothetical protein [Candidatus Neomarinimicrobiota bacterium]